MRLNIIIEDDAEDTEFYRQDPNAYESKTTSMTVRTEDFSGEELTTYTQYIVDYNDDLPTWLDNIDQCVKALEKHYGYSFDMKKYAKRIKNKETENTEKKTRLFEFFTEDPDH